jgi:thymidine phosphorylase
VREVLAPRAGTVEHLDAITVGVAALHLGAGRQVKTDVIDHTVGVVCRAKRGTAVSAGDVLAEVHARDEVSADTAVREVAAAYEIGEQTSHEQPVLLEVIA